METCGYCDGTGQVETRPYGNEGRANDGADHRTCEYCDGEGLCSQGDSLLPAAKPRTRESMQYSRHGLTVQE